MLDGEHGAAAVVPLAVARVVEKLGQAMHMPMRVAIAESSERDMASGIRVLPHTEADSGEATDLANTVGELRRDVDTLHARVGELREAVAEMTRLLQRLADDEDGAD